VTDRKDYFVTVVIPLYNEEESLVELYARLTEVLSASVRGYEILFVDDGSTDGSLGTLRELRVRDRRIKIISFKRNFGKSAALQEAFRVSRGDIVVTMDADLQDDPNEIPGLIDRLEEGADLVSGWKMDRKDPITKTIPSRLFNFVTSIASGIKIHDFNCGLKAYRADVVKKVSVYGELHRFIPVLAAWEGFRVTEKPVKHYERQFGESKFGVNRFLNGFFDLMTVMFITRRATSPLHFFGRIALIFLAIGGGISLYFLIIWLMGHGLRVRPLMVGGLVMVVIAIQIGSFGLLAELFSSDRERTFSFREYELDD
jgi:glycosyltransferase involved in cell wall biosynthesis